MCTYSIFNKMKFHFGLILNLHKNIECVISKQMSCSFHIFVFWFLVDWYQKNKISAIKFVYFFLQVFKNSLNWNFFLLIVSVKSKHKRIDSWYFGLLVAIYQIPKGKNMKWTRHVFWNYVYILCFRGNLKSSVGPKAKGLGP